MPENGREGSTRRSSFRKSLIEAALPQHFLEQLEEKRKQLDESIHKYIAQKEREYKLFEKEIRQQHKLAQGQNETSSLSKRRDSPVTEHGDQTHGHNESLETHQISAGNASMGRSAKRDIESQTPDAEDDLLRQQDRSTIAGLKDRRASIERDREFVGLFTPAYLPALDHRNVQALERTSSAPVSAQPLLKPDGHADVESSKRTNSDGAVSEKPKRPSHLALSYQNSSSGSSVDSKLTSAMKSPKPRLKTKRVSLALGDSIVAPSDNVPLSLSHNTTPSHSRTRSSVPDKDPPVPAKEPLIAPVEDNPRLDSVLQIPEQTDLSNATSGADQNVLEPKAVAAVPDHIERAENTWPGALSSSIDADGDLFDLEEEESGLAPRQANDNDELENALESEDEILEDGDSTRIDLENVQISPNEERYDSTTGLIPELKDGTDSAVPYLAFGPSSAVASQQPIKPGFRRPSVVYDPILRGERYQAAERDAVESDIYSSTFEKPVRGSFKGGSLGESYMAQHAEEMMKQRTTRQQTKVQS